MTSNAWPVYLGESIGRAPWTAQNAATPRYQSKSKGREVPAYTEIQEGDWVRVSPFEGKVSSVYDGTVDLQVQGLGYSVEYVPLENVTKLAHPPEPPPRSVVKIGGHTWFNLGAGAGWCRLVDPKDSSKTVWAELCRTWAEIYKPNFMVLN